MRFQTQTLLLLIAAFAIAAIFASPVAAQNAPQPKAKLPHGFVPPPQVPANLFVLKELITEDEILDFKRKKLLKFRDALKQNSINPAQVPLIADGAAYFVYRLTLKENRHQLGAIRAEAKRVIDFDSKTSGARTVLLEKMVEKATSLLDNSLYVRIHAILLLSEMSLNPGSAVRRTPPTAFVPAAVPLMTVIKDPNQHPAAKVAAATGLTRILNLGAPDRLDKVTNGIANDLIAAINVNNHWWYNYRLLEALEVANVGLDSVSRKPLVLQTLGEIIASNKYKWPFRCVACRAVGRVPVVPAVNIRVLSYEIAVMTQELAVAYNQAPQIGSWKSDAFNVYLAFKPRSIDEQKNRYGLLEGRTAQASAATYDAVLPILRHVIKNAPQTIPQTMLDNLKDWVAKNKPKTSSIATGLPPLRANAAPQNPPASTSQVATPAGP